MIKFYKIDLQDQKKYVIPAKCNIDVNIFPLLWDFTRILPIFCKACYHASQALKVNKLLLIFCLAK